MPKSAKTKSVLSTTVNAVNQAAWNVGDGRVGRESREGGTSWKLWVDG